MEQLFLGLTVNELLRQDDPKDVVYDPIICDTFRLAIANIANL